MGRPKGAVGGCEMPYTELTTVQSMGGGGGLEKSGVPVSNHQTPRKPPILVPSHAPSLPSALLSTAPLGPGASHVCIRSDLQY